MEYIIENANILKDSQLKKSSLLIQENRITSLQTGFKQYKLMKMNAEAFIMTPTYCLLNTNIPLTGTFQELKEFMINQFLMNGCTTLLTYASISYENELMKKINDVKTSLISSPIDFSIGVKIPMRLISQTFIRMCKKEKVPAIFVEFNNAGALEQIPWGWIKEALFPYNSPLIPIISSPQKKEERWLLSKWKETMVNEKISAVYEEIEENQPLSLSILNKIGLYPQKASLMHGAELSYNLYLKGREIKNVDEISLFHYHSDRLAVTVHKGKVIRAGKEVLFKPGNGEYVKVRTPSYFSL
ncbi:hypothetical protein [Neobacillus ginsengisoli]|uniref:Uncharacterized protein n=1 Tax=Neobacillus ginsengisoli TaxID=904295 RepID=A0ABT9XRG1_9BACI|nr:hypothetical protein [Neobacillus ginsengisoli]MDQ0197517.1 hypothetical protein [Neobacillus ginsengisoli]